MSAIETLLTMMPQLAESMRPGPNHIMVCCPFHGEKTPSLAISVDKPVWFCHGCHASGHLAQLLKLAGLSRAVIDALLPRGERVENFKEKKNLAARIMKGDELFTGKYVLDEEILDAYRLCPTLLLRAGFGMETLRHFEVGYDSKNMRITYPLRTVYGDLVGISGRTILDCHDTEIARYRIYDRELKERTDYTVPADYTMEEVKQALLWHGHVVRPLFFSKYENDTLIIVEGFKAAMWVWQAGYQDVVALVGSYLSDLHAEMIARVIKRVVLFLDNNKAGIKGTHQGARTLMRRGVEVFVASYPDEREQPDALFPEEIDHALDGRFTINEWRRRHVFHEDEAATAAHWLRR